MLNKKGFTLVELLAMMVVLGMLMAVSIPNIVGISEANKKQAYVEDAKKLKNSVEYLIRSDDTYVKPEISGYCVVMNMKHLLKSTDQAGTTSYNTKGSDYENAPYGGVYDVERSFVVMKNVGGEYKYGVQLIEVISATSYGGIKYTDYANLEGNAYLDKAFSSIASSDISDLPTDTDIHPPYGCSVINKVYKD